MTDISRRELLKGAATTSLVVAVLSVEFFVSGAPSRSPIPDASLHVVRIARIARANESFPNNAIQCRPSVEGLPLQADSAQFVTRLPGKYSLTLVASSGFGSDSIVSGNMSIVPADAQSGPSRQTSVLQLLVYGSTDADVSLLGELSLTERPTSPNARYPGVQGQYNTRTRQMNLVIGAPITARGVPLHAGLSLTIYSLEQKAVSGVWRYDGLQKKGQAQMSGYFCAMRKEAT
jgi:hypothetical protein